MSFEIEGKLHKKFDTESKTSNFQAREFVIAVDGTYPQFVKFQLTQDRCGLIDDFNEEDTIKVHFDLRGREWNGKYFTNLNAWKVESATATAASSETPIADDSAFPSANDEPVQEFNDDLPF